MNISTVIWMLSGETTVMPELLKENKNVRLACYDYIQSVITWDELVNKTYKEF